MSWTLRAVLLSLVALAASASPSAEKKFMVGEHGVQLNSITIESHTDLESIVTTTHAISGEVAWDMDGKTGTAKLTVPAKSLKTGIDERDKHLQGEGWLNAKKNPQITFEATAITARPDGMYDVTGTFSMAGVSRPVTAVATVKYLPHKPELDNIMPNANLVRITTSFELKFSDYGIKLPVIGLKVSDVLKVKAAILGVEKN